jgi:hypothetical protein
MTPMMAKCTGCMPTLAVSGARMVPRMMMAGMASMKQPSTRKQTATISPTLTTPPPQADTASTNSCGTWK